MLKIQIPHIAVEVNNSCNQDCVFCYNHRPHNPKSEKSKYHSLIKLLKEIYSQANIDNITFTGGEPLLEERLPELVLFAKMKKSLTTVISNGTLFSSQMTEELLVAKNDLFQLPVHSANADIHDKMTGLPGSHAKSKDAILRLKDKGANVVAVIVLTSLNVNDVVSTLRFIHSLGINQISVDRYNIGGKNKLAYADILPGLSELRAAYLLINDEAKRLNLRISSNVCTPHCVISPANYPHIRFGNCPENPLHFPLTIDELGDLRVCNHSPVVAGNIFKKKIPEIIQSDYIKSWSRNVPEECSSCKLWKGCRGGCRAASEQTGSDNSKADPILSKL